MRGPHRQPPASRQPARTHVGVAIILVTAGAALVGLPLLLLTVPEPVGPAVRPPVGSDGLEEPSAPRTAPTEPLGRAGVEAGDDGGAVSDEGDEFLTSPQEANAIGSLEPSATLSPPARRPSTQPRPLSPQRPTAVAKPPPANQRAQRRRQVERLGGTQRTEDAVELGLAWLAAHQNQEGTWSRMAFHRHCPPYDRCPGPAVRRKDHSLTSGLTGLSLLAFLGAGYTDRDGPYADTVARAVAALIRSQHNHGGFSSDESMASYNDSLATFALAEFYALIRDQDPGPAAGAADPDPRASRLVPILKRAVQRLTLSQQALGGWDYQPRPDTGRNDTSITAWAVQALQACSVAGIRVPPRVLILAAMHFARATGPDGRVWYADSGTGFEISTRTMQPVYRYGPAMTAAGLTCESLLGWRLDSEVVQTQRALLLEQAPSAHLLQADAGGLHSYYYWYYGTIAMFQRAGPDWERWNAQLRDAILPLQDRSHNSDGSRRHRYGSWDPFGTNWGKWGRMGGRVYTTAICVLTLETYYRHLPAYLEEHLALSAADWREALAEFTPRERRQAVQVLRETRHEIAEPVLIDLLQSDQPIDQSSTIALAAAEALAVLGSPLGGARLEEGLASLSVVERPRYERALRIIDQINQRPPARGSVRLYDADRRLATLALPDAWVGMTVDVLRGGQTIGTMRVIQRFSGRDVVVAELVSLTGSESPAQGDHVVQRKP